MKKTAIIIVSAIIVLLIIAELFHPKAQNSDITYDYKNLIEKTTAKTKLIDANLDHNQALDVMEYAKKNNIELPRIIVNFDTHSDVFLNDPGILPVSGVEDWINEYIAKNSQVDTLYWVIPNEESENIIMQWLMARRIYEIPKDFSPLIGNSIKKMNPLYFIINPIYKKSYTQYLLVDPKTKKTNEYIEGHELNKKLFKKKVKYKKVKVITCTKETLPDFNGEKVFLSIDADYLSNSGFDTAGDFRFIKSEQEITDTLYSIFKTTEDKNIVPVVISMSLSPQYLPKDKHIFVLKLFEQIIQYSKLQDLIHEYKHYYDPERYAD